MSEINENNNQKYKTFGERLRHLRVEKKLSQSELGKLTNTHYTQIGRYERGLSKPTAETLRLLAECLNVSTSYLYEGIDTDAAVADFDDKELLKMFNEAETLNEKDKMLIKEFLNAFLLKKRLEKQLVS